AWNWHPSERTPHRETLQAPLQRLPLVQGDLPRPQDRQDPRDPRLSPGVPRPPGAAEAPGRLHERGGVCRTGTQPREAGRIPPSRIPPGPPGFLFVDPQQDGVCAGFHIAPHLLRVAPQRLSRQVPPAVALRAALWWESALQRFLPTSVSRSQRL